MRAVGLITQITFVVIVCCAFFGGQAGRFEAAKRAGINYIESEQYDKAAGRLEEVWEQDQSDAVVGEYLALAYLNTEDRQGLGANQAQAFSIIHKLVGQGSCVMFAVLHSHERLSWLKGRELNQYCRGRLSICPNKLIYVADKGEKAGQHSFDVSSVEIKSVELNQRDQRGTFEIKMRDATYFMATRAHNPDEAKLITELVRKTIDSH